MEAFDQLCRVLAGRDRIGGNLLAVLNEANAQLVTPRLYTQLRDAEALAFLPPDAVAFLNEVAARNHERNRRLRAQLDAAVAALNGAGISPILLKGAGQLVPQGHACDRILSDLDLLIRPDQVVRGIEAMRAAGMTVLARYGGTRVHVVAEFGDAASVGLIDLHQRPAGPPGLVETQALLQHCRPATGLQGSALVPDRAHAILLLVLHDHFHDGRYWRGEIDLRHLLDLRDATAAGTPLDRREVLSLCPTPLIRDATGFFLSAGQRWLGANIRADQETATDRLNLGRARLQRTLPTVRGLTAVAWATLNGSKLLTHRTTLRQAAATWGLPSDRPPIRDRVRRMQSILSPG